MPHFLAIAWLYRDDYRHARHSAAAGARTRRPPHRTAGAALRRRPVARQPVAAAVGLAGRAYSVLATCSGAGFICAVRDVRARTIELTARRLFLYSIIYLPLLWTVLVIDRIWLSGGGSGNCNWHDSMPICRVERDAQRGGRPLPVHRLHSDSSGPSGDCTSDACSPPSLRRPPSSILVRRLPRTHRLAAFSGTRGCSGSCTSPFFFTHVVLAATILPLALTTTACGLRARSGT